MLYYLGISLETYGGETGCASARSRFGGLIDLREPARLLLRGGSQSLVLFLALGNRLVASRFGMVIRAAKSNEPTRAGDGFAPFRYKPPPSSSPGAPGGLAGACSPSDRVSDAGLHALDPVGRDHVHGDPRRHGDLVSGR